MRNIEALYDEIVQRDFLKTREAFRLLQRRMAARGCKFGNEIVPTFLKPVFLATEKIEDIKRIIRVIAGILEKITRIYFKRGDLADYFYVSERAKPWVEADQGYRRNIIIARPDAFLVDETIRFVEFNCDSPAGMGYSDVEEEIFLGLEPIEEIRGCFSLIYKNRSLRLLAALLETYREFAGSGNSPRIAIIDWKDVRTQNEFRILQEIFRKKGIDTVTADPRELSYSNGKLKKNGSSIDLVYRRAIFRELIEREADVQPLLKAYRDGRVCVVNPLRSRLASNKAILAIMTNQKKFKQLFTEEENRVIQKHVPWTRRLMDMRTDYEDNPVFLRKHVMHHRESLVLKPVDSYGGKNVAIGCDMTQKDWEGLVDRILRNREDWVVQKYVDISEMAVPVVNNNMVAMQRKKYNMNPFVFAGEYAGCLARLSDKSVINVSAGGGMVPVMMYARKE